MQMQEYIYLRTTPMYFLGASGRIVGRIESPHHRRTSSIPPLPPPVPPSPILQRFTSKLARSHGLIDHQVMAQFNSISKITNPRRRRRLRSIYSTISKKYPVFEL